MILQSQYIGCVWKTPNHKSGHNLYGIVVIQMEVRGYCVALCDIIGNNRLIGCSYVTKKMMFSDNNDKDGVVISS